MPWRRRRVDVCVFGLSIIGAGLLAQQGCVENSFFDADDDLDSRLTLEETFWQAPLPAVDVLWVVDDTASMAEEQAALADGFSRFVSKLEAQQLAYQIGVVTTAASSESGPVLRGDPWIITPAQADPEAAFAAAADVGLDGIEQAGLGALIAALTEPIIDSENRGFRREDAALFVVVVSDADDDSQEVLGGDPVGATLDFLSAESERTGRPARLSAIVGDDPGGCSGNGGRALPGSTYADAALASGGDVLSICSAEFESLLGSLGKLAISWPSTFALQALPLEGTTEVTVEGKRVDTGWTLQEDPPAVVFDDAPPAGAWIVVRYALAAAES
jgi:hypothetical protein